MGLCDGEGHVRYMVQPMGEGERIRWVVVDKRTGKGIDSGWKHYDDAVEQMAEYNRREEKEKGGMRE